jgi:hypothetical protein
MAALEGLEPSVSAVTGQRFSQLSYSTMLSKWADIYASATQRLQRPQVPPAILSLGRTLLNAPANICVEGFID